MQVFGGFHGAIRLPSIRRLIKNLKKLRIKNCCRLFEVENVLSGRCSFHLKFHLPIFLFCVRDCSKLPRSAESPTPSQQLLLGWGHALRINFQILNSSFSAQEKMVKTPASDFQ